MSSKDLRAQKTEQALRDAFLDLTRHQSFDKLTIQDLCDQAQIRRSTFYRHYQDKFDFLGQLTHYLLAEFNQKNRTSYSVLQPEDFYRAVIEEILNFLQDYHYLSLSLLSSDYYTLIADILYQQIYQTIANRFQLEKKNGFVFYMEEERLAEFLAGGIIRVVFNWVRSGQTTEIDLLSEQIYKMLIQFWKSIPNTQQSQDSSELNQ